MKINLSGHHVEVNDSIKKDTEEKFSKIANHFPTLIALDVIISKQHHQYQVEVTTNYEGNQISAKASNEVMYPAIASAAKKLDAELSHRKGQLKADLHKKPDAVSAEIAYEKVQEMNLD